MRAHVDPDGCIGCGVCAALAAEVFEMDDSGKAVVISDTTAENEGLVQEAIDECPVQAIREEE